MATGIPISEGNAQALRARFAGNSRISDTPPKTAGVSQPPSQRQRKAALEAETATSSRPKATPRASTNSTEATAAPDAPALAALATPTYRTSSATAAGPGHPASDQIDRLCKYLMDQKLMERDEKTVSITSLAAVLFGFKGSKVTKEVLWNGAENVAKMLIILAADHITALLDIIAEKDQRFDNLFKATMGRMEDSIDELKLQVADVPVVTRSETVPVPEGATADPFDIHVRLPDPTTPREKKARNNERVRNCQVLYKPFAHDAPEGIDMPPTSGADTIVAERFRAAIREGDLEKKAGTALLPLRARILAGADIVVDFPSPAAANWARSSEGSDAFQHHLRYHMGAVGRQFKVVVRVVPTTFAGPWLFVEPCKTRLRGNTVIQIARG
ncbi:hypothetical protein PENSPDRAFT_719332, partial [Peniophora sp. CONT]